jgi:hypothetical protein
MDKIPFKDDSTTRRRLDFSHHPLKTEERVKRFCEVFYKGKVFVSHTAADTGWCHDHIIPHLGRFDDYFFLSWRAPPHLLDLHQALVVFAFRSVKTVIAVISTDAIASDWVRLEVKWAIEQKHPVIVCLKDDSNPAELHAALATPETWSISDVPPRRIIDFRQDSGAAERELRRLLQTDEFEIEVDLWAIEMARQRDWKA